MKFSKIILPLTTAQNEKAVAAFTRGMVALTNEERQLYQEACQKWQEAIQEAASEAD